MLKQHKKKSRKFDETSKSARTFAKRNSFKNPRMVGSKELDERNIDLYYNDDNLEIELERKMA